MDIVSRLKQFIESHGIAVTQFADTCRIPRPTLSQLLNGRNKKVSDEIISKIHTAYPSLSMMWLMFGEGNMEAGDMTRTASQAAVAAEPAAPMRPIDMEVRSVPRPITTPPMPDAAPKMSQCDMGAPSSMQSAMAENDGADSPDLLKFDVAYIADSPDNMAKRQREFGRTHSAAEERTKDHSDGRITFDTSRKGKRVVSIVVYYDDKSYESFVPDPSARSPFS